VPELHQARLQGLAGDAWYPEILALVGSTSVAERAALRSIILTRPRVAVAALTTEVDLMGEYRVEFQGDGTAVLQPFGLPFTPQRLPLAVLQSMGRVMTVADAPAVGPGPDESWPDGPTPVRSPVDEGTWAELVEELEHGQVIEPTPPPALLVATQPGLSEAAPGLPLALVAPDLTTTAPVAPSLAASLTATDQAVAEVEPTPPYVRVLGPVDVTGATGSVEPSKANRLTEYLVYLVLHPQVTAPTIDDAIWPNRGRDDNTSTRNTATSKLRKWLGDDPAGRPYLPPFSYTCVGVGSDWADWQQLIGPRALGQVPTERLEAAIALVRGRPFEGVNRRGYRWTDRLQQTMVIAITDACWELARRRYRAGDYRGTDSALAIALGVSPGDEALWRLRIAACHAGGDHHGEQAAIDAVCLIAADLGCDLEEETLGLIAQMQREHQR
jgi:hypothetical protein